MLLRNSFSQTKKFFQRSIESFKSFLSNGYTKLPISPSSHCTFNPFSCTRGGSDMKFNHSYRELDSFYAEYTKNQCNADGKKETATDSITDSIVTPSPPTTKSTRLNNQDSTKPRTVTLLRQDHRQTVRKGKGKERMGFLSDEKLRELEMMDRGNVEHVLDIEEVFHYYSQLTCPTYLDIVDKFFVEMYSEFCAMQAADLGGVSVSRRQVRRRRSIKA